MNIKYLNLGLLLSSLIGYLEWGENSAFLFETEAEILVKMFSDPLSILHPFVLLPFFGQILLIITLFQKKPSKVLTYIGIGCIGLLLLLMFLIGVMELHLKILGSTLPFLILSVLTILTFRKQKQATAE
jgi:hypothetical protein